MNSRLSGRAWRGFWTLLLTGAATFGTASAASAAITATANSADVASSIAVAPPTGSAFTIAPPGPPLANGFADTLLTGFPTSGATYGILTSGDVELADDPNASEGDGFGHATTGYNEANDPSTLRIDVNVPAGNNCLAFDFRFLTEEFPEFVGSPFNDAFIAQLDVLSVDVTGSTIAAPGDFAAGADNEISVNAQGPTLMSAAESAGTTYDGATPKLIARVPAAPGTHSLYLTIFDAGDDILDSAVFVDNLRFENVAAGKCKSIGAEPFEGLTGVTVDGGSPLKFCAAYSCTKFNLSCNLPGGAPIPCSPFIAVQVNFAAGTVGRPTHGKRAPKPVTIASAQATVPADTTQEVSLPTSTEGAKALKQAVKSSKKLKKQAKKLERKAKKADGAEAKKLKKKAKKLKKKAKKALKPNGKLVVTNASNGATETVPVQLNLKAVE